MAVTDQWTHAGWDSCLDCGKPSQHLRCPACLVAHIRAYRRTVTAATTRPGHWWPRRVA